MLHIPVLRRGRPVPEPRRGAASRTSARGSRSSRSARPTPASSAATSCEAGRPRCAPARRASRADELIAHLPPRRPPLHGGHAAARRRGPDAGRLRPPALGHHRPAARDGAPQHGKIRGVLARDAPVLAGLTRSLDLAVLDRGCGRGGRARGQLHPARAPLGRRPPSNSPGVHSLWVPGRRPEDGAGAEAGQRRALDAVPARSRRFIDGGRAAGRLRLLPDRPRGRGRDPARCGRGHGLRRHRHDEAWRSDPRVEVHGPGYSKVVLGPDAAATGRATWT